MSVEIVKISEDELYHHGIKGMKWGVRRYQNEDGSLTSAGRKHYGIGPSGSSHGIFKKKKKPENRVETTQAEPKSKPKSVKDMSDDEIRSAMARRQLEMQYEAMFSGPKAEEKTHYGKKFVETMMDKAVTGIATSAGSAVSDWTNKWLHDALGVPLEKPKTVKEKLQEQYDIAKLKKNIADLQKNDKEKEDLQREYDLAKLRKDKADLEKSDPYKDVKKEYDYTKTKHDLDELNDKELQKALRDSKLAKARGTKPDTTEVDTDEFRDFLEEFDYEEWKKKRDAQHDDMSEGGYLIHTDHGDVFLSHHGIKGMKWGVRRYQNEDGTLTEAGKKRYNKLEKKAGLSQKQINSYNYSVVNKDKEIAAEQSKLETLTKEMDAMTPNSFDVAEFKTDQWGCPAAEMRIGDQHGVNVTVTSGELDEKSAKAVKDFLKDFDVDKQREGLAKEFYDEMEKDGQLDDWAYSLSRDQFKKQLKLYALDIDPEWGTYYAMWDDPKLTSHSLDIEGSVKDHKARHYSMNG